jgi:hypothetical protein
MLGLAGTQMTDPAHLARYAMPRLSCVTHKFTRIYARAPGKKMRSDLVYMDVVGSTLSSVYDGIGNAKIIGNRASDIQGKAEADALLNV